MDSSSSGRPGPQHPSESNRDLQPVLDQTVASYDHNAAQYAALWSNLRLERALEAFASRVSAPRRVLDLGCGPGRDVDHLVRLGCWAVGLDLSPRMLVEARRRFPTAPFVQADLRATPLARGDFDGVWACASLLHLPRCQLPMALIEIARLLHRPGGVLYLALKGGQGEQWLADHDGRRRFFSYYHFFEIETLLHQARFQIIEDWVVPDQAGRDRCWINVVARMQG